MEIIHDGIDKVWKKLELWGEASIGMAPNILLALGIIFAFWVLSNLVAKYLSKALAKAHFSKSLENLLTNIGKIAVICMGLVFALGVLQLQKTVFSLLAGVGVIGLALGFAFQDLAANFMSGIILAIRAPIKLNDIVKINGIMGTVVDIRLRDTKVRNFSGQDVFIPNKHFMENEFINYSSYGQRRVKIEVGIGYEDDPLRGREIVKDTLKNLDNILVDPEPEAYINSLGGSSVNLEGRVWIKYPGENYLEIKNNAIARVKKALESNGFNIPFPIRTIDLNEKTKDLLEQSFKSSNKGQKQDNS